MVQLRHIKEPRDEDKYISSNHAIDYKICKATASKHLQPVTRQVSGNRFTLSPFLGISTRNHRNTQNQRLLQQQYKHSRKQE